jgi:putative PIG3 family NAD(P)H quinone oxidoreductase
MPLPSNMHVVEIREPGGPEVLQWAERPLPEMGASEVLIKVTAAGLNRADLLQRQGKYPPPEGASDVLGMEVSGVIAALGKGVTRWKIGDKVCALLAGGGYAEYVPSPEGQCLPVPENISLIEAAALPEAVCTVFVNVFEAGRLAPDETVLVHGGASGIGTTAIQMVKAFGAKIFITAGDDEKCVACKKLGADLAINYKSEDFVAAIMRATGARGVDVVLDMIGGDYVARNLAALAPFGRHVSISTQRGKSATIDLRDVMQKRLILTGSTLRHRPREEKARLLRAVEEKAWPWVAQGRLKPLIFKTFAIKNAVDAHKMMESGAHIGKIVLEVAS